MEVKATKVKRKELAKIIDAAANIDAEIKNLKIKLDGYREDLDSDLDPGKYITTGGHSVTVSETTTYTEIDPTKAKKALKAKRQGKFFPDCVKIALTQLKRYLSDQELEELREVKGTSRRYSFK